MGEPLIATWLIRFKRFPGSFITGVLIGRNRRLVVGIHWCRTNAGFSVSLDVGIHSHVSTPADTDRVLRAAREALDKAIGDQEPDRGDG